MQTNDGGDVVLWGRYGEGIPVVLTRGEVCVIIYIEKVTCIVKMQ